MSEESITRTDVELRIQFNHRSWSQFRCFLKQLQVFKAVSIISLAVYTSGGENHYEVNQQVVSCCPLTEIPQGLIIGLTI